MKQLASLRARMLLVVPLFCAATVYAAALPERVYKAAQQRVDAGEYPALVIGYVDGDKSEVDVFGKLDNGNTPDSDTVFEIGSITKTFTASLLAEAVQSGKLKLDTPVATLLPDFKIPARDGKQITLVDLATQHSGLPRLPANLATDNPNPYADYDAAKLRTFLAGYELTRDPGSSYEYSNLGFGLLGFALAQQARTNYPALLKQEILKPLDMAMSGVVLDDTMRAHLARGHGEDGKDSKNWDFDALAGCGAIRSTANDMLRYLKANMGVGKTPLVSAMKFAQQPRRDMNKDWRIGLAWMTNVQGNVVWHNGGTGGYSSFLGFDTDGRHGIVILTNIHRTVDDLGFAALQPDFPLPPARKTVTLASASLDDYIGDYKLEEGFLLNISRNGEQLYAQATGQGAFPIFSSAKDEFFAKIADISISFQRDAQGKIGGLILHQNGDRTAPRLSAGQVPAAAVKAIKLDATLLREYSGTYQLAPGMAFEIGLTDDQLHAQLTGQAAYPVYASAKDKFFYTVIDAQLDFERDKNGKVDALILHQNGQDQRASRIAP